MGQETTANTAKASHDSTAAAAAAQPKRKGTKTAAIADFFSGTSELVSSFAVSSGKSSFARSRRDKSGSFPGHANANDRKEESEEDDEILNLDLVDELFRGTDSCSSTPYEPPGPEAFNTIFANAQRLFMRVQIAYQAKHGEVAAAHAQMREEMEAVEEARERNQHLRAQLDAMSGRVREQDDLLAELTAELGRERALRRKDAERRERSERVLSRGDDHDDDEARLRRRCKEGSEEGASSSIYSSREAAGPQTQSQSRNSEEGAGSSVYSSRDVSGSRPTIWSRRDSLSSASISTMPDETEEPWFTPGAFGGGLREENMRLKTRVAELEEAVDGCLALVGDF